MNTQENEEYRGYVDEWQIGLNCTPGDVEDVALKLEMLAVDPDLRRRMGENNRTFAEAHFDRRHTYKEMVKIMGRLLKETPEEKYVL